MLTLFEDKEKIFDALCAGATGYLQKKSIPKQIIESIEELQKGGSPMSSGIARKVMEYFSKPANTGTQNKYQPTLREHKVLQ